MKSVEVLIQEIVESGELARQLRGVHRSYQHFLEFDDFQQEVVIRTWERREQFQGQTSGELLAWMHTLARHLAIDKWRTHGRQRGLLESLQELLRPLLAPAPPALEQADLVRWLMAGLNEQEIRLLTLKYYQHLSTDELRTELGLPSNNAVYARLERVIGKLQQRAKKITE